MIKKVNIDLSPILQYVGFIMPNYEHEIDIITNYSYITDNDHDTYAYIANKLKNDHKIKNIERLESFYSLLKSVIDISIISKIDPNFENITFSKISERNANKLIVEFNLEYV